MFRTFIALLLLVTSITYAGAHPSNGIVVNRQGHVYFADERRNHVWKIDLDGTLSPLVTGKHTHTLFLDPQDNLYGVNYVYVPNGEKWEVSLWKLSSEGRLIDILAPTLEPTPGWGVVVDRQGNRYSGDWFGSDRQGQEAQVLKRTPGGEVIVLAGRGKRQTGRNRTANLTIFRDMALGPRQELYVADNSAVYRISPDGVVTTFVSSFDSINGSHSGVKTQLSGITADADGNVYVADMGRRRIIKVSPRRRITTVAHTRAPWAPTGVALHKGVMYILEHQTNFPNNGSGPRVRKVSPGRAGTILAEVKN